MCQDQIYEKIVVKNHLNLADKEEQVILMSKGLQKHVLERIE